MTFANQSAYRLATWQNSDIVLNADKFFRLGKVSQKFGN
jgi:hypothetical protein